MKVLKYIAISIGSLITLFFLFVFIVVYFYEDKVKSYIISELNKNLLTEVNVENVNFSVLKKFPNASIEFENIVIKSSTNLNKKDFSINCDTMLSAKSLFLEFSITDIFSDEYNLKTIDIENGKLNILIDNKENGNFVFWKETSDTVQTNIQFQLKAVELKSVKLRYVDKIQDIDAKANIKNMSFSGNFNEEKYSLEAESRFYLNKLVINKVAYLKNKNIVSDFELDVENDIYKFNAGDLHIENLKFDVIGTVINSEKTNLDLSIKGKELDIQSFISLLPEQYKKEFAEYESTGSFYFDSNIKGEVSYSAMPHIEAKFGVENAQVKTESATINSLNLVGNYTNGAGNSSVTSQLKLKNISARFNNNHLKGSYEITNFVNPKVDVVAEFNFKLDELKQFARLDTLSLFSGEMVGNIKFSGAIKSLNEITKQDLKTATTEGKLAINNATLQIKNNPYKLEGLNAAFDFDNNNLTVEKLNFNIAENDVSLKGSFNNFMSFILVENQVLTVNADVYSKNFDLGYFLDTYQKSESSGGNAGIFPPNMVYNISLEAEKFSCYRFDANSLHAGINYKDNKLYAHSVGFKSMGGNITGETVISLLNNNNMLIQCSANLSKIDIKKLFYSFNNFSQEFIQDKHLKGIITASIDFSSEWTPNLDVIEDKIIANANLEISNGQLLNFEPMMELSDYIEVTELKNIKFSKLKNNILIKDRNIIIPQMDINSSAINITASGTHSFDNIFAYKIKVLLSDVLAKNVKKKSKENDEFGYIEDDGLGRTSVFLLIQGTPDNYKVSYDTRKAKENIKESFDTEKKTLKTMLNQEFGWFKNDSAVIQNKEKEKNKAENQKFRIKWDENAAPEKENLEED